MNTSVIGRLSAATKPDDTAGRTAGLNRSRNTPSWFVQQQENTWAAVAADKKSTIRAAYFSFGGQSPTGFRDKIANAPRAWTGGCVDQTRGELIFPALGGHDGYAGNEVYACNIRSERPSWYRLTDHSPASVISPVPLSAARAVGHVAASTSNLRADQGFDPKGFAAMYLDGRMRTVHGYHSALFARGKVWYHHQSSAEGVGNSTPHAWSFDRSHSPGGSEGSMPTSPSDAPLKWANNPGPWTWLGTTESGDQRATSKGQDFGVAPPSALDPATGLIWTAHANQATRVWSSLDTATGLTRRCDKVNRFAANTGQSARWATVVLDPSGQDRWRFWVAPAPNANGLIVLDLKASNPYAESAWSIRPVNDFSLVTGYAQGAVYHRPSVAILLGDPKQQGNTLVVLRVPTRKDGRYDNEATWQASLVTPAEGSADTRINIDSNHNGAWSKFNIIDDMGNGHSALVVCMEVDAPTFVYKFPSRGL